MVSKIDLPPSFRSGAEAFEKAWINEECLRRHHEYELRMVEDPKTRLIKNSIFLSLSIIFVGVSSFLHWFFLLFTCFLLFFMLIFFLMSLLNVYCDHKSKKIWAKLNSEESKQEREQILKNDAYHLAWVMMIRINAFNASFDLLTGSSSDEWNDWVQKRFFLQHQEILEEIKACPFFKAPVRDLALVPATDRLRHYLLLEPSEFQRLYQR
ncbi:TPA: hypothetical protein DEP34_04810 [Candidatus Uhrbacteria bacterium]|uniref:Uncharacterized protein n=2 Tax=Candidatus Uhriibacteriota TaxID=1752732 RepID=A0A0G1T645_9BACT|nr:MAG: hypothetical protein UX45_C0006G0022 [Candidatus Uhrbacteria bacterium GW2011_GWF2_46_218]KKU40855.1 MAG: hypothetical protein UX57_C0009G0022 [Candidatus Uhrbacteria bacterium GW2011_GWE2_46_68]HBK33911.1 hypothetical protein [Candidatus Uhrbacteria bacterium]HCB19664.1 hypothetical protein [Candidatus Uhrbacteria bacterium]